MMRIAFAWLLLFDLTFGKLTEVNVELKKFDMCEEDQKTPFRIQDIALTLVGKNKIEIDGDVVVEEMAGAVISVNVDLSRCTDQDTLSSCEHVLQKTIKDICPHLSAKNKPWSDLVSNIKNFEPSCPLKQGQYALTKAPFDIGPFAGIPTIKGYWIAKVKLFADDQEVGCQSVEAMIKPKGLLG